MPNRIIKESINESVSLADVSPFAQDLFKRLITYADDYGRFNAGPDMILARLYPRELMSVDLDDIRSALFELVGEGKIKVYRAPATASRWRGDVEFGHMPGWSDHQRIRQAKHKNPDPESEEVNDVYLRRHIPKDLKVAVFVRDKAVCQCCKKDFSLSGVSIERSMRLLSGVLHFDHIVPVSHGGRATYENLRLTCASCNLSRPKKVDAHEVLADCENSPQVAANFRLNPIQSNPNPNPIVCAPSDRMPSTEDGCDEDRNEKAKPKQVKRAHQIPADFSPHVEVVAFAEEVGASVRDELPKFRDYYTANGKTMKDWQAAFRNWLRNSKQFAKPSKPAQRSPVADGFASKDYGTGGLL